MTTNAKTDSLSERPLQHALKAKNRNRSKQSMTLATTSPPPGVMRNDLVPKLAFVECAPSDLVVPARNVRKVKPTHLREVAAAISSFGFCDPVLIDERNTVLDGGARRGCQASRPAPHTLHPRRSSNRRGTPFGPRSFESPQREGQLESRHA